jgi:hypothetical protein
MGFPSSLLSEWINRGMAQPEIEPWGPFAIAYKRAERGLTRATALGAALRVQVIVEQLEAYLEWKNARGPAPRRPARPEKPRNPSPEEHDAYESDYASWELREELWREQLTAWQTPPEIPSSKDMEWMLKLEEARAPDESGRSPHRAIDPQDDPAAWLERQGLTHDQLVALFDDPPEPVTRALVANGDKVYSVLIAGGWSPQKEKAE